MGKKKRKRKVKRQETEGIMLRKKFRYTPPTHVLKGVELDKFVEFLRKEIVGSYGVMNLGQVLRRLITRHNYMDKDNAMNYLHYLAERKALNPIKQVNTGKKKDLYFLMGFKPENFYEGEKEK